MADEKKETKAEAPKPTSRPKFTFVGHRRASNGTAKIAGAWGEVTRGGPAAWIPAEVLATLEDAGYTFEREEVND